MDSREAIKFLLIGLLAPLIGWAMSRLIARLRRRDSILALPVGQAIARLLGPRDRPRA
jgi:hypothetical protein